MPQISAPLIRMFGRLPRHNRMYAHPLAFIRVLTESMSQPRFLPWSQVKSWICDACGECCRWFKVPLTMHEYAMITQNYGHDVPALGVGRAYVRRRTDGRCVFQFKRYGRWLCGLQAQKPRACRMWPFIVSSNPVHGRGDAARWEGRHGRAHVYVDPRCSRIRFGKPTGYLVDKVLPEVMRMAYGQRETQLHTTCNPLLTRIMEMTSSESYGAERVFMLHGTTIIPAVFTEPLEAGQFISCSEKACVADPMNL